MIGRMLYPMTNEMLSDLLGGFKYKDMVFTPELIKLLVYHRIKRVYERKLL